jgi:hypothetical protein
VILTEIIVGCDSSEQAASVAKDNHKGFSA